MRWIAHDPIYSHPLPVGHRFPMLKYELIPQQLLYEGTIQPENIFSPDVCAKEIVLWTHDEAYYDKLIHQTLSASEERHIGFPQSQQLTRRELVIAQGTIDCAKLALKQAVAFNVAGGTHHAFKDRGEGFCLLNDFAIAANYLLRTQLSKKIVIIDLDVHQGNGTAKIFQSVPAVFTYSIHGEHNYPFRKEKSDYDIGLKDGTDDQTYLHVVQETLEEVLELVKPDFAFYLSGVDVLVTDKFGKLGLTMNGCLKRDEIVFSLLQKRKIPCAVAMGGGYSEDIKLIVEAHCNTFRVAKSRYQIQ
jgi:acetoin utilization deacetylase AcuC-like enzyme